MRWSRISRPSPALVVSIIALVVAMGGTSYAAFTVPNNSVGNHQLKNNSVGNRKLQNGSVGNAKLRKGSVSGANIQNGAITAANLNLSALGTVPSATNAINALNASNASKATTAASASALGGVQYVSSASVDNPANSQTRGSVTCPSGLFVSGGGALGSSPDTDQAINSSLPFAASGTIPNAWAVDMNNTSAATDHSFTVFAICIPESNPASAFARHADGQTKTK